MLHGLDLTSRSPNVHEHFGRESARHALAPPYPAAVARTTAKPLRGIFAIAQTPFTESNQLDLKVLAREVKFFDHGGVHGFVWPQMASEYLTLTKSEAIGRGRGDRGDGKTPAAGDGDRCASSGGSNRRGVRPSRGKARRRCDHFTASCATGDDDALLAYYKEVGAGDRPPPGSRKPPAT